MAGLLIVLCVAGIVLFFSYKRNTTYHHDEQDNSILPTIDAIDSLLPQTQCGQCHYPGCRPYAEAIALGKADIHQCPPGGESTVRALSQLLGMEAKPLSRVTDEPVPQVALIDEDLCIGCVKCIKACPVDAIMGTHKRMHTVIKKYCTGCELCVPVCPVDCIDMVPARIKTKEWVWSKPAPDSRPPA
jgi:electron transport complex protein RnfB